MFSSFLFLNCGKNSWNSFLQTLVKLVPVNVSNNNASYCKLKIGFTEVEFSYYKNFGELVIRETPKTHKVLLLVCAVGCNRYR